MFVTLSDFEDRPYRIPNQEESKDLEDFMEVSEEVVLKKLLGVALYDDLIDGTDISPALQAQKWIDLRDGAHYTVDDVEYEYKGLVDFLVPCIYSMWLTEVRDKFTNNGVVFNLNDKAEHISPARRIVSSFNEFSRKVGGYWSQCNTLYGFLITNDTNYNDFDGSLFEEPGTINEFGI